MKTFRDIENKNQEHDLCKREKAPRFLFCFPFFVIYSFKQNLQELIFNFKTFASTPRVNIIRLNYHLYISLKTCMRKATT